MKKKQELSDLVKCLLSLLLAMTCGSIVRVSHLRHVVIIAVASLECRKINLQLESQEP